MTLAPADVAPQEPTAAARRGAVAAAWPRYAGRRLLTGVGHDGLRPGVQLLPVPDAARATRSRSTPAAATWTATSCASCGGTSTSRSAPQFIDYLRTRSPRASTRPSSPGRSGTSSATTSGRRWCCSCTSTVLAAVIGIAIGIRGGWKRGSTFDRTSTGITLTLYAMPEFWLGMVLLILFSTGIGPFPGIFPSGGTITPGLDPWSLEGILDQLWHLALPAATLTLGLPGRVRAGDAVLAGRRDPAGLPDRPPAPRA